MWSARKKAEGGRQKAKAAHGLLLLTFCLLPPAFPGAQQAPPAAPQVFRSETQVVEVDARVFDRDGRFVTTLTRDDFEILEDGVSQPIVAMTLIGSAPAEPARSAEPARPAVPAESAPTRQTWVFFFDINHLTPGQGFERAREAAAAFVRERFRDGDMAGVIDARGMVNGRLTNKRDEAAAAIESVKPNGDARSRFVEMTREWPRLLSVDEAAQIVDNRLDAIEAAVCRATQDRINRLECQEEDEPPVREKARRVVDDAQRPTTETLRTIDALAAGLARMSGPKTVVFISQGFPIAGLDTALRSIVGQTARAGARVYSLDVRGMNRAGDTVDQAQSTNTAGAQPSFDAQADGFNSLAVDTGGMMIRNENNFGRALDRIAADAHQYYVIGYQPANATLDGKYRKIDVRVKRADVRVRARRGYLALAPAQMLVPQPIRSSGAADPNAPAVPVSPAEPALPAPSADSPAIRARADAAERVRALSGGDANAESGGSDARAGWEAYRRGDLESALPPFERAAASPGVPAWALYALGLTYAGLGRPDAAITAWERMRAASPGYHQVYTDLASTYASRGRLTDALATLRDAAARWPGSADFHNGIGVILVRRDALDDAIDAFTKAVAAAPDDPLTHLNLGRAHELRYSRNMRFIASQSRWVAPEGDRKKAAAAYQRCIDLGGPYARQAAAALGRLEWTGEK